MARKFLTITITLFLVANVYHNRQAFLTPYAADYYQRIFPDTQFVRGGKAVYKLSDYEAYAIIGYKYWHGDDPLRLHTEAPPLGKYLIGASIQIFNNPAVLNLLLALFSLSLIYHFSKTFLSPVGSLISILLISIDQVFWEGATTSNIDMPQFFFILVSFFFFLRRRYFAASFVIGLVMATKFYFNGLILLGVYYLFLLIKSNFRDFMAFTLSLPLVIAGYVLPYLPGLIRHPDILEFIRLQRWLTSWWAGNARVPWGGIFSIIFLGQWRTWWPGPPVVPVPQWTVLWPISTLLSLFSFRRHPTQLLFWLWSFSYLAFLTITSPFPRYILALLPLTTPLALYVFSKVKR